MKTIDTETTAAGAAANEQTFRRLIDEAFSGGDLTVVDELVAPRAVEHQNGIDGNGEGPEGVKRSIMGLRSSFPDLRLTVEDLTTDGDKVWARLRGRATNSGPIMGRPATGRTIELDVIDIARFAGGKMVEHWGVADRLGMLQQVGLVPGPPQDHRAV